MRIITSEMREGMERLRKEFKDKLLGYTVVDVVVEPSLEYGVMRPDLGLVLRREGVLPETPLMKAEPNLVVWACQDAENNGPGWLVVEEVKS